jgi:hypothetical protein
MGKTQQRKHNWDALIIDVIRALKEGECLPTWKSIAEFLDVPLTSLKDAFRNHLGIKSAKQLHGLLEMEISKEGEIVYPEDYLGVDPQAVIHILKDGETTLTDLSDRLDRGSTRVNRAVTAMILDGYAIMIEGEKVIMPTYAPAEPLPTLYDQRAKEICWAEISDLHFGSRFAQVSALLKFIDVAYNRFGCRVFFISGDIFAGTKVYRGQENELYAHGGDDQIESALLTIPELEGVAYIMIGGNHDYSFHRWAGVNVVKSLCDKREDMYYAGFDQAEIPLLLDKNGKVIASSILWHPSGGVPYALSYRGQKFAEQVSQAELMNVVLEEKPSPTVRFIQWGHLHVSSFFPHGAMWVSGPGCFEGTSGYLKAKGLKPQIQGVINQAELTPSGIIGMHTFTRIQFQEQAEDYHCAHIPSLKRKAEKLEPIFKLQDN